jgi:hypothetical protein
MPEIRSATTYKSTPFPFPSDEIPTSKKNETWAKEWCEAIYSEYMRDQTGILYSTKYYMQELRDYGNGRQDRDKYKELIYQWEKGDVSKKGFVNLDFEIFSVIPKFRRIVVSMIDNIKHKPIAHAIDEKAVREKDRMKFRKWVEKEHGEELNKLRKMLGVKPQNQGYIPDSIEELELLSSVGGFKLWTEDSITKGLNYTFYTSKWPEIRRKLIEDLFDIGVCGSRDYVDQDTLEVKTRYLDPIYSIVSYSRSNEFENAVYAGELKPVSAIQLRERGISETELNSLAQSVNGKYGNPYIENWDNYNDVNSDGSYRYDNFRFWELDAEWFSLNSKYQTTRKNQYGVEMTYDEKYGTVHNSDKRKTSVTKVKVVYTCKWLVGTDVVYDFGLARDIPRPDKKEAKLSFHFYKMHGKSFGELCKSPADQIQLLYLKIQNIIAMTAPPGLAVEWQALSNMSLGGKKMEPLELLKIYRQTGDVIYKATTHRGQITSTPGKPPINELSGGDLTQMMQFVKLMEWHINNIRELTGVNRIADASNPNPEDSVGGSQLAVTATNNALYPVYVGIRDIEEFTSRNCSLRLKELLAHSEKAREVYEPIIGKKSVELLKSTNDMSDAKLGIKIEVLPTREKVEKLRGAAIAAMKPGKAGVPILGYGDLLFIERMLDNGNLIPAEAYMTMKEAKAEQRADQRSKEMMLIDGANSQKKDAAKHAQEVEQKQLESQLKIQEDTAETENKMKLDDHQTNNKIRLEAKKSEFKTQETVVEKSVENEFAGQESA